jgi:hypothetical protein
MVRIRRFLDPDRVSSLTEVEKEEHDAEVLAIQDAYQEECEMEEIAGPIDIVILEEGSITDEDVSDMSMEEILNGTLPEPINVDAIICIEEGESFEYPKTCATLTNDEALPLRIIGPDKKYFMIYGEPFICNEDNVAYTTRVLHDIQEKHKIKVQTGSYILSHV